MRAFASLAASHRIAKWSTGPKHTRAATPSPSPPSRRAFQNVAGDRARAVLQRRARRRRRPSRSPRQRGPAARCGASRILRLEVDRPPRRRAARPRLAEALPSSCMTNLMASPVAPQRAVKIPLVGHHVEAGRLLRRERAQPFPVAADSSARRRCTTATRHAVTQLLQLLVAYARCAPVKRPCRCRTITSLWRRAPPSPPR